jgi:GTPase SAR1 family protein
LNWLEDFKLQCREDSQILLVGNKLDLVQADKSMRKVEFKEAEALARQHKSLYMETSALTSKNVDPAFLKLMKEVYQKRKKMGVVRPLEGMPLNTKSFYDNKDNNEGKKNCCAN